MTTRVLSLFVLCAVMYQMCLAKPAKVLQNPESLSPGQHGEATSVTDNKREQRSPQFGLLGGDYSESDFDEERTVKQRRYRRPQECLEFACGPLGPVPPLGPLVPPVPLGPLGPPVPPVYPPPPLYPEQTGGSFATASAGSLDGPIDEQSAASAQSANLNLGPFSASFSNADSSASSQIF